MTGAADWHAVHSKAHEAIQEYTAPTPENAPVNAAWNQADAEKGGEMLEKITEVLQARVMPALAADGGGLQVVDLERRP
jgi:hypothetical protein